MNQMSKVSQVPSVTSSVPSSRIGAAAVPLAGAPASDATGEVLPLTDVFVPLDSIKPGE
jgi:hypothetical protein